MTTPLIKPSVERSENVTPQKLCLLPLICESMIVPLRCSQTTPPQTCRIRQLSFLSASNPAGTGDIRPKCQCWMSTFQASEMPKLAATPNAYFGLLLFFGSGSLVSWVGWVLDCRWYLIWYCGPVGFGHLVGDIWRHLFRLTSHLTPVCSIYCNWIFDNLADFRSVTLGKVKVIIFWPNWSQL